MIFSASLPGIPPSTNHAYINLRQGGRMLSAKGKKYKMETTSALVRSYPIELKAFQPDAPYGLCIIICAPTILNSGWPKTAKTRYKKLDASNRVKLLEDAIVEAAGIDDSQFMLSIVMKAQHTSEETLILCWSTEKEVMPLYVSEYLHHI